MRTASGRGATPVRFPPRQPQQSATLSPADAEIRDALVAALREHGGNMSAVARQMGRDPKQIRRWVKRFGLTREP